MDINNDFFTERDNNFGIISNKIAYYYNKVFNIEIMSLLYKKKIAAQINDIIINEQEKNKNYNPNDIFKTEEKNDIQEKTEKENFNSLIEHKENKCYKRILSFIKNIFKRQKNS